MALQVMEGDQEANKHDEARRACDCENAGNVNIRDFLQRNFCMLWSCLCFSVIQRVVA